MLEEEKVNSILNKTEVKIKEEETLLQEIEEFIVKKLLNQLQPEEELKALKFLKLKHTFNLLRDLYQLRKKVNLKILKTKTFRDNVISNQWTIKKEKSKTYTLIFENLKTKEKVINVQDKFYIGKSKEGNQKIFQKTHKDTNFKWYHADIRGGGLIANKLLDEESAAAWALIYSKHLKVNLCPSGLVSVTTQIGNAPAIGSFIFKDGINMKADSQNAKLYFKIIENQVIVSHLPMESPGIITHLIPKDNTSKFQELLDVLNKKNVKVINLRLLDQCIPHNWNLKVELS